MLKTSEKKIIYWLDNNSRMSNQELATKVGLSKQAIGQNITQLQKKGIIDGFITFVNTLSLGYTHYKIFLKLHNTNTQIESEFITYLVNRDDIRWVVSLSGKYDLSFSLLTTNPQEFNKKYAEIESRFGKYILERNVVTVADVIGYSRNYLIENTLPKSLEYTYIDKRDLIDETDKHILKTISQDARMKIIDIAKKLNLSVDVVKYRLKKLVKNNIISGFTLKINLRNLGYEYYSFLLNTTNYNKKVEDKIKIFLQKHPNTIFFAKVIGNYDVQIEFECKDYYELEKNVKEFRETFSQNIRDFEILRVIDEYKNDFYPFND